MRRILLVVHAVLLLFPSGAAYPPFIVSGQVLRDTPPLKEGDLLFQDLDCGPLCDAIEAVTEGAEGMDFSHVGIAVKVNGRMMVVESIGAHVHATDSDTFLLRGQRVIVGRPIHSTRSVAKRAAREAADLIGTPYDDAFLPGNDRLYCSELVALSYQRANRDRPFFAMPSMTFKDPRTGAYFPAWVAYFAELRMPIPEGQPGCNPGGLSRDSSLRIVWRSTDR